MLGHVLIFHLNLAPLLKIVVACVNRQTQYGILIVTINLQFIGLLEPDILQCIISVFDYLLVSSIVKLNLFQILLQNGYPLVYFIHLFHIYHQRPIKNALHVQHIIKMKLA